MCTICTWTGSGQGVFTFRNMDWAAGDMPSNVWVIPRGVERVAALPQDPNPMKWTSKYGSVGTQIFDIGTGDGMNEKGLHAAILYLAPSDYGPRNPELPAISVTEWVEYYLDNFATVAEAVEATNATPYQIVSMDVEKTPAVLHLHLADATGDAAVIEFMDAKMDIYHGQQCQILTNLPPFPEQLDNLKNYEVYGGDLPLPGTTASPDRFVRAHFYRDGMPKAANREQAIEYMRGIAQNVAQPFGTVSKYREMVAPTLWRSLSDHTNLIYYYEDSAHPSEVWLDFKNLDFAPGAPAMTIPPKNVDFKVGEQSANLVPKEPHFQLL